MIAISILNNSFWILLSGPRKSFDEQRNGWLEISEIVDIVKEPDGNLKIAENAHDIKLATEDADQKTVEQDFGTDDEAETKRKMFALVDRVS